MSAYYLGIDVYVQRALLGEDGRIEAQASRPLVTWTYESDSRLHEQSSVQIWDAITACVHQVLDTAKVDAASVHGIGFDATCSLVVTTKDNVPVSVTPPHAAKGVDASARNVILWADHRAHEEADLINRTGHKVLDYVGGTMSLEMETPKTLWLQKHMDPATFAQCTFFDLPDYLSYYATGSPARSNCSLVCKYGFIPQGAAGNTLGWQPDFLREIGLGVLEGPSQTFDALGGVPGKNGLVLTAGMPVGAGLCERAARELRLLPHTPVSSSLIDAYAGWVGTVAARDEDVVLQNATLRDANTRLVAIAGTSTCYCVANDEGIHVGGVWGPYKNAVFPGMWMNEGGQSSTGQLIDFVLETHPAFPALREEAAAKSVSVFALLEVSLEEQMRAAGIAVYAPSSYILLVKHMYMYPDFYGNRSPLADTSLRGMLCGLSLDRSRADLARRYILTLEAIALQTRHIVEEMNASGHKIDSIYLSGGGQARNLLFAQLVSDACNMRVQLPKEASVSVVTGMAFLARLAANMTQELDPDAQDGRATRPVIADQAKADQVGPEYAHRLWSIMQNMTQPGKSIFPSAADGKTRQLLAAKYRVFREMIPLQRRWKDQADAALGL
ncbi:hypothetical protein MVES_002048 [Malassezia vespertilionis]|uniref:Uncharacterized protein n=1 Tax=Malassezia vespertilionis TaxID=2020962 RepID=A0A2N1JBT4_9BASI|nr:hypothetical protein MVES_002048 [Malassezia vespertilionis]